MSKTTALLHLLSDGRFHSGEALGSTLGITRATVWNNLHALEELGIDLYAVPGKGYRLPTPIELLLVDAVREAISEPARKLLSGLDIFMELPSTNAYLLQQAQQGAATGWACFAECQSAGRGRRGRTWVSPFGGNIYLSVLWRFESGSAVANGLSLAVGVAVAEALHAAAIPGVALKWPNDIVCQGKKLAGILLEMAGEASGPCYVVVGIGVNVALSPDAARAIDQPWIDIASLNRSTALTRNQLAGSVLQHVLLALQTFAQDGLAPFLPRWRALDAFAGQAAQLQLPQETLHGTVQGIDERGALLFSHHGDTRAYAMGELSLRGVHA